MFRDLKEYQEIAKIYADKVSKPENLEERRGSSTQQLAQNRKDAFKPVTPPQKGAGGGVGNPTNTRGTGGSTIKPIVRGAQGRTRRPQPEIKKFPSTAEIRAKSDRVGGGNAGASTDAGLASTANMPKATPVSAEPKKPVVSTTTKQGKPRTKAQMMAAKRIAAGKSISDVKAENQAAMKAKAKERFAAFKAKRAEKNKPVGTPTRKETSSTTQSGNTTTTKTKVTSGTGGGTKGLTSSAGSLEANKKKAAKMQAIADKNAAMEKEFESKQFDAYDLVLEYLLSTEQAATIEEANYVMTEMDAETIQGIVEEQKKTLTEKPGDGYIGPKFLNIKNPITNFINKKRNESPIGGNKRVDDTRKGSGDDKVGEKIYFK